VAGELELYLFDSGTLALSGVEVPVPFFLLRHPQGLSHRRRQPAGCRT
jgi:hypothetical protein